MLCAPAWEPNVTYDSSIPPAPLAPLLRTLRVWENLSDDDTQAILGLPCTVRSLQAHQFIVWDGDRPQVSCALLSGFAFRHKIATGGARQILSIDMPGDFVDVQNSLMGRADHSVQMISDGVIALIPTADLLAMIARRPAVARAIWRSTLAESAVFREWITNVGRRDAYARVSHLLCEFAWRAQMADLGEAGTYELPLSQLQLADAVSLTEVHINRTIKRLRVEGLVEQRRGSLAILNWQGLVSAAEFDPVYLMPHWNPRGDASQPRVPAWHAS
jgi:CRP-like cAMP-binding protein